MQQLAAYWIGVTVQAIQTFPGFIGSNWTGVLLSATVLFYKTWGNIAQYLRSNPLRLGWRLHVQAIRAAIMKTDWKVIAAIPVCFWLGNVLQIAYQDQKTLANKNYQLTDALLQQMRDCKERASGASKACDEVISSLKQQNAGEASKAQTLDEQVQSQRNTIDNFGAQIVKATVQPRIITPVILDFDNSNVADKKDRWVLLSNKNVDESHIIVNCDQPIEITDHQVLNGDNTINHLPQKMNSYTWDVILSSRWTPVTPVLIGVTHKGEDKIVCGFAPR